MTIHLDGPWDKGFAFDVHTLSSTYLGVDEFGHDRFDNTRSEMGDLVYKLKYQKDAGALDEIVQRLDKITGVEEFDVIIPIPPTNKSRAFQPVEEIAKALGKRRRVGVLTDVLVKRAGGPELKNVDDPNKRERLLDESLSVEDAKAIEGKNVLVVDDLYRSGATLSAATRALKEAGAKKVGVLTMTKTRSKT